MSGERKRYFSFSRYQGWPVWKQRLYRVDSISFPKYWKNWNKGDRIGAHIWWIRHLLANDDYQTTTFGFKKNSLIHPYSDYIYHILHEAVFWISVKNFVIVFSWGELIIFNLFEKTCANVAWRENLKHQNNNLLLVLPSMSSMRTKLWKTSDVS